MTRFVYLDEAGISNPEHEPFVVVAGFALHVDDQWRHLERYMSDMIEDLIPPERRDGFYFHAADIWSGNEKGHFPKSLVSGDYRWKVLEELVSIPERFDLPVFLGFNERAKRMFANVPNITRGQEVIAEQTACYHNVALQVERYMRELCPPDEVALLIHERADAAKPIKDIHRMLRDPKFEWEASGTHWDQFMPFERIVETAHFADKEDSLPLQLADTCAFIIKRHLMGRTNSEKLYQRLAPQMFMIPNIDLEPKPSPKAGDEES